MNYNLQKSNFVKTCTYQNLYQPKLVQILHNTCAKLVQNLRKTCAKLVQNLYCKTISNAAVMDSFESCFSKVLEEVGQPGRFSPERSIQGVT